MTRFFDRPTTKQVGVVGAALVIGLAIGNGYRTTDAMADQARWLHDWCGQQVKKTVVKHQAEDVATFGFTPEDLQAPLPKAKK